MTHIGIDLNSSRVRAVRAAATTSFGIAATPLLLEDTGSALPLALHLAGRTPTVGSFAVSRFRHEPHLVCQNFLPFLGQPRSWNANGTRIDALGAMRHVFEALGPRFGNTTGVAASVPDYLSVAQVNLLTGLTNKLRWKLLGSVPASLAATLAVYPQLPWSGTVLVIDVDDHGLSCAAVVLTPDRVVRLAARSAPTLGTSAWVRRLLEGTAQRCIRLSRRDPRDSAEADQSLTAQLHRLIEKPPLGDDFLSLAITTASWSQHLMLRPHELTGFCLPLVQQALGLIGQVHETLLASPQAGPLAGVIFTPLAAGLPGLHAALERSLAPQPTTYQPDDLGAGLLHADSFPPRVHVLHPDDLARAVLSLAHLFKAGRIAPGFRETAPLPRPLLEDAGPPRLHFQGSDYELGSGVFSLGRDPGCNLAFASEQYPHISSHHCDVLLDQRHYTLRDHSRHGTLVNERPVRQCLALHSGDRIRLGPQGPILQFFGRS